MILHLRGLPLFTILEYCELFSWPSSYVVVVLINKTDVTNLRRECHLFTENGSSLNTLTMLLIACFIQSGLVQIKHENRIELVIIQNIVSITVNNIHDSSIHQFSLYSIIDS